MLNVSWFSGSVERSPKPNNMTTWLKTVLQTVRQNLKSFVWICITTRCHCILMRACHRRWVMTQSGHDSPSWLYSMWHYTISSLQIFFFAVDFSLYSYGRQKRENSHSSQKVDKERKRRVQEKCKYPTTLNWFFCFQQHVQKKSRRSSENKIIFHQIYYFSSGNLMGKRLISSRALTITRLIRRFQCLCNVYVSLPRRKKKQQTSLKNLCLHLKTVRKAEWRHLFVVALWMQLKVRAAGHRALRWGFSFYALHHVLCWLNLF